MSRVEATSPPAAWQRRIGDRWIDAINHRDADALVRLSHERVAVAPAVPAQRTYLGHGGIRQWIADLIAADRGVHVEITRARVHTTGKLLLAGRLFADRNPPCLFAAALELRDGLILSSRSYLRNGELLTGQRRGRVRRRPPSPAPRHLGMVTSPLTPSGQPQ